MFSLHETTIESRPTRGLCVCVSAFPPGDTLYEHSFTGSAAILCTGWIDVLKEALEETGWMDGGPAVLSTQGRERESSLLTTYWSGSTDVFGVPASRHGSVNPLFQVASYLPS